ncbi:helix-turn-helix domain-containing protein [Rhizobium sp. L1K21]|uniref:AraC family transcriptional regulator n=1 Tax=Rhizobium sp. L1K21 TaxID=2954933 RepID=UPI0020929E65|nr:helix-turn-helix transcriptional regulator [Rhizobium sp. L1K21]MCO6184994.1 helix-turn-helix transcriptional regulator [Rhizobium sp. L1K21]
MTDQSTKQVEHQISLHWLDTAERSVVAKAHDYETADFIPTHRHNRAQLIYILNGMAAVSTAQGRWIVPPDHALWIPVGVEHSVELSGPTAMRSIYVKPGIGVPLPEASRVVGLTDLMRSLILEAVRAPRTGELTSRDAAILALILEEIPRLPEKPFSLPLPQYEKLAALCRSFLSAPQQDAKIDSWAEKIGVSRRTFTRLFREETGLSFSTWRQQACILAAISKLTDGEQVTMIALDLGYETTAAFTTMFKRMTGQNPSRYLRQAA